MPVTLTLTDDQALDIMSQVSSILSNKHKALSESPMPRAFFKSRKNREPSCALVEEFVGKLSSGAEFRHIEARHAIGANKITPNVVSYALGKLAKKGDIKMVKRGTWKKV